MLGNSTIYNIKTTITGPFVWGSKPCLPACPAVGHVGKEPSSENIDPEIGLNSMQGNFIRTITVDKF